MNAPRPVQPAAATIDIRFDEVSKHYGEVKAVDRVSFAIARGSFHSFLGPSGCGKTTLLRAIAGLDPQTSGTIRQKGRDVSALPPAQRDFGIVFQSYALFPNLTVTDNVGYGLVSRRQARGAIAKRVTELLALVGLPDAGPKYPAQDTLQFQLPHAKHLCNRFARRTRYQRSLQVTQRG